MVLPWWGHGGSIVHGVPVVGPSCLFGGFMVLPWSVHGESMVSPWWVHPFMEGPWCLYGVYVRIYGASVEGPWWICGWSVVGPMVRPWWVRGGAIVGPSLSQSRSVVDA